MDLGMADDAGYERNLMHTGPYLRRDRRKINLGLNESPYQIPLDIKAAVISALDRLHEYPLGFELIVIEDLAKFYHVDPAQVAITHGLDEALDRMIELFPNMRFSIFEPTFLGYEARLRLNKVNHQIIRLDERFSIPEEALCQLGRNDFVILANPNNPTGTVFDEAVIDRLHRQCGKIFIDEAYIDYSEAKTRLDRLDDRTFVFKSLSKVFALAGQRLGFLFGDKTNIAPLKNRQWFCNTNIFSLELIRAILRDPFMSKYAALVVQTRERLRLAALELGFNVRESFTNFVIFSLPDSQHFIQFLDSRGICVTDTAVYGLKGYVRVSVGTPAETDTLIAALQHYASQAGKTGSSNAA